jgi:hypothetical protein
MDNPSSQPQKKKLETIVKKGVVQKDLHCGRFVDSSTSLDFF